MENQEEKVFAIQRDFSVERRVLHRVYIYGEVKDTGEYEELWKLLAEADEFTTIEFWFQSWGGDAATAAFFVECVRQSSARTTARVIAAHSAGSVMALACNELIPALHSEMILHNITTELSGTPAQIDAQRKHLKVYYEGIMRQVYSGFLSDEEMERMFEEPRTEYYFTRDEILNRKIKPDTPTTTFTPIPDGQGNVVGKYISVDSIRKWIDDKSTT